MTKAELWTLEKMPAVDLGPHVDQDDINYQRFFEDKLQKLLLYRILGMGKDKLDFAEFTKADGFSGFHRGMCYEDGGIDLYYNSFIIEPENCFTALMEKLLDMADGSYEVWSLYNDDLTTLYYEADSQACRDYIDALPSVLSVIGADNRTADAVKNCLPGLEKEVYEYLDADPGAEYGDMRVYMLKSKFIGSILEKGGRDAAYIGRLLHKLPFFEEGVYNGTWYGGFFIGYNDYSGYYEDYSEFSLYMPQTAAALLLYKKLEEIKAKKEVKYEAA